MAGKLLLMMAFFVTAIGVLPAPALAQARPCGDTYVMARGDTLHQVAQQCRVPLDALLNANPEIDDVRNIAIGTTLWMPGDGTPELPPGQGDEGISVQPLAGAPGTPIHVSGSGYRPGTVVTIGSGPPASEWDPLEEAIVGPDGTVEAIVDIPERVKPGRQIVMVINTPEGETHVSQRIDVVAERAPDAPVPDSDEENGGISVEGRISSGVECPVLITPEGTIYALVGGHDFERGAYVRVEGRMAEVSFCMQGEGTISVDTIRTVAQPDEGGDPATPGQIIPD